MARITIEDCLKIIPNRFDLTLCATARARQLAHGAVPMLEANRDKPTVIALRELAARKYDTSILGARSAAGLPSDGATSESAWQRITSTAGDAAPDRKQGKVAA